MFDLNNKSSRDSSTASKNTEDMQCPFRLQQICTICWKHEVKSQCRDGEDKCQSLQAHIWSKNHGYLLVPENKIIRQLRCDTAQYCRSKICPKMKSKRHNKSGNCKYAHNHEEIEVWKWMCKNKGIVKLTYLTYHKNNLSWERGVIH